MLGISVYFQDLDYEYLRVCKEKGVKYIFTSLHIPEEDYSKLDSILPEFLKKTQEYGLIVCPDVSPVTFEKLGVTYGDFETLKKMGFKALRLDYGFDDISYIKELINDFELMLNASVVDETMIQSLISENIDLDKITMTHNFYPKRFTGISREFLRKKNEIFRKYNIKVQAFVCGDDLKRFPLYEGLPTVENHRDLHPLAAALDLLSLGVTDIMIGDSKAKMETIEALSALLQNNTVHIKCAFEDQYNHLYDKVFDCRKDESQDVIRLLVNRQENIVPFNNGIRKAGFITMDNTLMGRYSGEISVLKNDLPSDTRTNTIGYIHPMYLDVLGKIEASMKIKFVKM